MVYIKRDIDMICACCIVNTYNVSLFIVYTQGDIAMLVRITNSLKGLGLEFWNFIQFILAILCIPVILGFLVALIISLAAIFMIIDALIFIGLMKDPDEDTFFLGLIPREEGQTFISSFIQMLVLLWSQIRQATRETT